MNFVWNHVLLPKKIAFIFKSVRWQWHECVNVCPDYDVSPFRLFDVSGLRLDFSSVRYGAIRSKTKTMGNNEGSISRDLFATMETYVVVWRSTDLPIVPSTNLINKEIHFIFLFSTGIHIRTFDLSTFRPFRRFDVFDFPTFRPKSILTVDCILRKLCVSML
jgi:hypothetical protein